MAHTARLLEVTSQFMLKRLFLPPRILFANLCRLGYEADLAAQLEMHSCSWEASGELLSAAVCSYRRRSKLRMVSQRKA